ncbi:MAG: DUF421 domain-containing protein [Leptolyngbyaceae cyanobacterium]
MNFSLNPLNHTLLVGSLAYFCVVLFLRLSGKRTLSKWNAFDFVVTVAFGSILATVAMSEKTSLLQGILGIGLLIAWQFLMTWLAVRSSVIQKLIKGQPTLLLFEGAFQESALANERVTHGEVLAAIRAKGLAAVEKVAAVVLETDGTFSVIENLDGEFNSSAMSDVQGFLSPHGDPAP